MAIYTIADLHLSINDQTNKSMEVFGARWSGYVEKLEQHWRNTVHQSDTVVIPGDISWALTLEEATQDLNFLHSLPGKKLIGKGNHDFWWSTASKIYSFFNENEIKSISLLHNNAYLLDDCIICGSRGWFYDEKQQKTVGDVDYEKIVDFLLKKVSKRLREMLFMEG